jgi:hypothetical protein
MTAPAVVTTKKSSVFEDIVDVFYAPSAVFERRKNAGYGAAFLIYVLVAAVMFYAARPVLRPMFEKQIGQQIEKLQANPNIPAEQKEAMSARMRGMVDSPFALIGPMIAIPVSLLLVGLGMWIAGKIFGSAATFRQSMMVATFASFPRLLVSTLVTGFAIATGKEVSSQFALSLSPAMLLPDDASPVLAAALSRLDVGVLWTTILLGIGIAIVGRMTRGKGLGAAAIVWVIGGLIIIGSAMAQSP